MIGGFVQKVIGGCASNPNRKRNSIHKREKKHFRKRKGSVSTSPAALPVRRSSNAGSRVGDFPFFDSMDSENAAPTTYRKSDVSNKKFYHSHSKKHLNGMFRINPVKRYETCSIVLTVSICLVRFMILFCFWT